MRVCEICGYKGSKFFEFDISPMYHATCQSERRPFFVSLGNINYSFPGLNTPRLLAPTKTNEFSLPTILSSQAHVHIASSLKESKCMYKIHDFTM